MNIKKYQSIIEYVETCLSEHGDSHLGVGWPKAEDADTRYRIMLELIPELNKDTIVAPLEILDFGCGASHLYDYILQNKIGNLTYYGFDISPKFIDLSRKKHPDVTYFCADILEDAIDLPTFDYIIMNGIFTVKRSLSYHEMLDYFRRLIKSVFPYAKRGLAFNVMSTHVDWQRDDLFHLPLDVLAEFIIREFGRSFVIRNDYGLYEYTVYLYRSEDEQT